MTSVPDVRGDGELLERVVMGGDLSALTPAQRVEYYRSVCESLGLNPLTQPFAYLKLDGRLTLYARRDATDQLRRIHGISVHITSREVMGDIYVVSARASTEDGRVDESIGAVDISGLKGSALANALMKAESKAKRRVTLSICGLGWSDETEVETIPGVRVLPAEELDAVETPSPAKIEDKRPRNGVTEAHWTTDERVCERFWAYIERKGLSSEDVYTALGVDHLEDYGGSMAEAKEAIEGYVDWWGKQEANKQYLNRLALQEDDAEADR